MTLWPHGDNLDMMSTTMAQRQWLCELPSEAKQLNLGQQNAAALWDVNLQQYLANDYYPLRRNCVVIVPTTMA